MRPADHSEHAFKHAVATGAKVSVRWRKASATYVIYVGGKVYMSGLGREQAINIATDELKADKIDLSRA